MKSNKKRVVIIGGGHGQAAICRGLKLVEDIDLTAIVTVADDGGSTGRLRKHFDIPAMGDIRNVMVSLAESESLLSTLMDFRFESSEDSEDTDVQGHNLGNLILTALTKSCGSFMEAIATIEKILNVKGKIIPASLQLVTLYAKMIDGTIVKGEANIPNFDNRITEVFYDHDVRATPSAIKAILNADLIIYGIGSLYTSILPNIIIKDIDDALKKSKAKKVYFCNVMSQPGETDGYSVEEHVDALLRHGATVDKVVIASDIVPNNLINKYLKEGSTLVRVLKDNHEYEIESYPLLDFKDNLIRHDYNKIKEVVQKLLKEG
ncbi:MAG: uridine diphosphate-N-acetylglucosamine-binding protein YvcK [Erysipelotrichaceae bacterium]|nr:uridine diphosphate-N-acetylglucosamine-binding protein YvcK [Erysipelotrichaceae bacterium]